MDAKQYEQACEATAKPTPRKIKAHIIGRWCRQGDINIFMVAPDHAHGPAIKSRQLAEGTARGARHICGAGPKIYRGSKLPPACTDRRTPLGPCIVAKEAFEITHPTHADYHFPAGTYQITYQMNGHTWARTQD